MFAPIRPSPIMPTSIWSSPLRATFRTRIEASGSGDRMPRPDDPEPSWRVGGPELEGALRAHQNSKTCASGAGPGQRAPSLRDGRAYDITAPAAPAAWPGNLSGNP